eukprot:SAG11_NODE_10996_length_790_cov_2.973951_1_plen_60_part_01
MTLCCSAFEPSCLHFCVPWYHVIVVLVLLSLKLLFSVFFVVVIFLPGLKNILCLFPASIN